MSYNTRIKLKSDTESNWLSQDPVLLDGEVAIVKCDGGITRKKNGDGSKKFSELAYDESKSLGLTSAAVGQIPKVKAVDSNGVPTEWESVAMPSGGSSDMFYVLDMVDGEGDTYTINNDFDEAVSAIDQGKVFVYEGACLLATYSSSDGTANQITLGLDGFEGHIAILTWNRGNSSATVKLYLSPVIDPEAITTAGALYYDGGFTIKSEAELGGAYVVETDSNDVLINDYTEFENAVKKGMHIVIKAGDDSFAVCVSSAYTDSTIDCTFSIRSSLLIVTFDKATKKATASMYTLPIITDESSSGAVYYDKTANSYPIKDMTPQTASASTAGTIKVGKGLSISDDGTLSVTTATYYTGTSDPVDTLGADGDLYLQTEG